MIIHCVSLPRASERRRRIHREWVAARGFDVRFFDAFDRRQEGVEPLPFAYDDKLTRARLGRSLSSGGDRLCQLPCTARAPGPRWRLCRSGGAGG